MRLARLESEAQRPSGAEQMLLAYDLVDRPRAERFREWFFWFSFE